jgi:phosphate-selective porin OprO and OprP
MKYTFLLIVITILFPTAVLTQERSLNAWWDDGLKFESNDQTFKFSVGGRVHYDAVFLHQNNSLDSIFEKAEDNVEVRRARLTFTGSINEALAYEFEFTFGETIRYADMYFAFLNVPVFEKLTVGHFREPFGMEELTSSNSIVFMERSLTSAFGPSRNTGIMLQKTFGNEKFRAFLGGFRVTDDLGTDILGTGKHSLSARLAYTPFYDTSTNNAFHLGASTRFFRPEDKQYTVKTQNETNISPDYINSTLLENVSNVKLLGFEIGYTIKDLFLQGEYIHSFAVQKTQDNVPRTEVYDYNSFYLMASYFLKGGQRRYNKNSNRFSDITVQKRKEKGKLGNAWEIAARISRINIASSDKNIDHMTDATFGLNWYFNSNSRLMMNYVISVLPQDLFANSLQFRMQVSF